MLMIAVLGMMMRIVILMIVRLLMLVMLMVFCHGDDDSDGIVMEAMMTMWWRSLWTQHRNTPDHM